MNREGVDRFMENVKEKYAFRILNEMEKAEKKGKDEGKIETARKMKSDNLPLDTIRKYTDLSVEVIQAL